MKMKCWKMLLLLTGLWFSVSAFSQRRNLLMFHDPLLGKDTIISRVNFMFRDRLEKQYSIGVRLLDGNLREFKSHEIAGYREGRKNYYSRRLQTNGEVRQVLLPRVYDVDSVTIYLFIQDDGKRKLYGEIGSRDSLLFPITETDNPLLAYLKEFPIAKDERVSAYFDELTASVGSFEKRHRVARTGNPNYITRFRWGIMLGASLGKADVAPFAYADKLLGYGGLFVEIPVYESFSVRPEVTFCPYAYSSHQTSEVGEVNAVYHRKDISGTLLFRYTLRSFKGKWLPFVQIGPELNFVLDKSMESARRWIDDKGYTVLNNEIHPVQTGTALGLTAGLGTEYLLSSRHSLFFDVRYRYELEEEGLRGLCLTVSLNL